MKSTHIFLLFVLSSAVFCITQETSDSSTQTDDTTQAEATATETPVSDDKPAAFLNVMKDKTWVYSGNCPEKPKR